MFEEEEKDNLRLDNRLRNSFVSLKNLEDVELRRKQEAKMHYLRLKIKEERKKDPYYISDKDVKKEVVYLNLQGRNDPDCPWFLDLDVSKEFTSFLDKIDHFKLTREIGRTTKWGSKDKMGLKFISFFLPYFKEMFIRSKRKKIYTKLNRYIQGKNQEWKDRKEYTLYLWVNKSYQIAQLEIIHKFRTSNIFKPF